MNEITDDDPRPLAAPGRRELVGELRAARELVRLPFRTRRLARLPAGQWRPVIVLPGFGAGDGSTVLLRRFLRGLGHDVRGWGLGRNGGDVEALLPRVAAVVERVADDAGGPIPLVGWSLGGVLARETARDRPDVVARVITYGTPVVGGPAYTTTARFYGAEQVAEIVAAVRERNRIPIEVPITAVYSRADGIVDWRACIDRVSPDVENVEVSSTHVGMGIDPDVWTVVATRLAAS